MMHLILAGLAVAATIQATEQSSPVTFTKDVLPILQNNCQTCHRPGQVAPMSLLSYKETRPWAKAIKTAVTMRKMPPWFADPKYGHFRNERKLTDAEIHTIVAWVDNGAPEGDLKDRPAPAQFAEGWSIGKPDIVVEFPHDVQIPATGVLDPSNLLVKVNFPHDIWVRAAEVRPGNRRVVHHMKAWVRPPGSAWMKDAPEGEMYRPMRGQFSEASNTAASFSAESADRPRAAQEILAKYNPGVNAQEFSPGGAAKFIAAGSDIVFELHYTTTGKPETDRSKVGIVLATEPPQLRYLTTTGVNNTKFIIPAHASNYEVKAENTIQSDAQLAWVQPHMHLRAKDYELRAVYPTGESEILMKTRFDFNWQLGYDFAKPIVLPKGTRLETTAHFDNSANNPYNPNPDIDVRYGPQTTDEMIVSFMGFIVDVKSDPAKLLPRQGRTTQHVE
jgi:hypothetical protein